MVAKGLARRDAAQEEKQSSGQLRADGRDAVFAAAASVEAEVARTPDLARSQPQGHR